MDTDDDDDDDANNNNTWTIFMLLLSSYLEHYESSLGSRGDCRNSASGRHPLDQANRPELEARLESGDSL